MTTTASYQIKRVRMLGSKGIKHEKTNHHNHSHRFKFKYNNHPLTPVYSDMADISNLCKICALSPYGKRNFQIINSPYLKTLHSA